MMKDTLDVTWKLAPIAIIPPGLMVWMYLKSIHWTSIFYESIATGSGLIFLALASLLVFFFFAVTFITPSFLLTITAAIYTHEEKIPQQVVSQYRWALAGWLIAAMSIGFDGFLWLLAIIPITFSAGRGLYLLYRSWTPLPTRWAIMLKIGKTVGIGGLASLAMSWQVFPMLLCFKLVQHLKDQSEFAQLLIVGACVLLSTISILPGFMYLHFRTLHTGMLKSMRALLTGILLTEKYEPAAEPMLEKTTDLAAAGQNCVPVKNDEVREFSVAPQKVSPK